MDVIEIIVSRSLLVIFVIFRSGLFRWISRAIPIVPDVQLAWLLLLHCASTRANFNLRVIRPELALQFARGHDARLWQCLSRILGMPENFCDEITRHAATVPLALEVWGWGARKGLVWRPIGRVGPTHCRWSRSAIRQWPSWSLDPCRKVPILRLFRMQRWNWTVWKGLWCRWTALAGGLRPEPREPEMHEPGGQRAGWQHEAASRVEWHFRAEHILPHLTPTRRAMLRSRARST